MQSADFNLQYAASIPAISTSLHAVTGGATSAKFLYDQQQNNVLDLLIANDMYDFGSGAWFMATQCSGSVRSALQQGDQAGWAEYMTGCVGAETVPDRLAYWQRGMHAFGAW